MPKLYQLLGTKNRKEQEQRVEWLLNDSRRPIVVLTILQNGGDIKFEVVGNGPVTTKDLKDLCIEVHERLTKMEVEANAADRDDVADSDMPAGDTDSDTVVEE